MRDFLVLVFLVAVLAAFAPWPRKILLTDATGAVALALYDQSGNGNPPLTAHLPTNWQAFAGFDEKRYFAWRNHDGTLTWLSWRKGPVLRLLGGRPTAAYSIRPL